MNTRWVRILACLMGAAVGAAGCSRPFYRMQADADAYCLTDQKAAILGSDPEEYRIAIDPRSRMFDPNNPDVEPMPPDDPTSNRYMQCVDCKKGSKCWKCLPKTAFVENPAWQQYLPRNEKGKVVLDMRGAVELALLESPEYQTELEDLYLSALDVSFERFRFDTQFFGGSEVFLTAEGRDATGTGNSSTDFVVSPLRRSPPGPSRLGGTRFRAERLSATGSELVVGVANSLVWQFAGPNDYTSTTLMDFSLVQPLLRAGGRTRVLERLTISERSLLANVRQMERYRRGFYLNVVTGRDAGQGPSRRGGFFGGSGLEGFAGVGGGGFGNVGNFGGGFGGFGGIGGGQGVGGGFTGGAGAQGAGGYVGLLQTAQNIRNRRSNVASLRDSFEQLQASYDAGRIDRFQVDLALQALYNAQSQLITAEAGYQTVLDNYKVRLGLPPDIDVSIEDPFLDRFNLLDPQLDAVEARVGETLGRLRELRQRLQDNPPADPNDPAIAERFDRLIEECADLEAAAIERIDAVEADLRAVDAALPQRRQYLERLADRPEVRDAEIDPKLFNVDELEARVAQRRQEFEALKAHLATVWLKLEELEKNNQVDVAALLPTLVDTLADLSSRLLELSLVQAGARLEAISFEPVELTSEEAVLIASAYRRDWQNARASLVDTWRLIYFNANTLLSDLDLVFSGDIGNVGDNPFDIRDTTGRLRVGVQFDAPLTRLAERNIYRQSLIEYQQARRSYYQFRDRISQSLRNTLRQIRLNEINFELRRAAVLVAISQVDLTQLRLSEPPQPTAAGAAAAPQFGDTTARDLVQSLSDLLNVQDDFLSVWVNYEVQRLNLDFDLGIMEIDEAGLRREHEAPLAAYIASAEAIRRQNCLDVDMYPAVGEVLETSPGEGEFIQPLPLRMPESVDPDSAEPLPAPLQNPAANLGSKPLADAKGPLQGRGEIVLTSAEIAIPILPPPSAIRRSGGADNGTFALPSVVYADGRPVGLSSAEKSPDAAAAAPYNEAK